MKIKFSIIISAIYFFAATFLSAQDTNSIELIGVVFDAETDAPLPFAHIVIKDKFTGTITNEIGEFAFVFNEEFVNDSLVVSYTVYKLYVEKISKIYQQTQKTFLEPTILNLEEIAVTQIDAKSIVKTAIDKIPKNYWKDPIILRDFYPETIKENERFTEYAEGVIDIYKNPYNSGNKDQARLIKGRRKNDLSTYRLSIEDVRLKVMVDYQQVDDYWHVKNKILEKREAIPQSELEVFYRLGYRLLRGKKELNNAEIVFKLLLDLAHNPPFAYAYLGEIEIERGNKTQAKEYLSRSLKLDEYNPLALKLMDSIN